MSYATTTTLRDGRLRAGRDDREGLSGPSRSCGQALFTQRTFNQLTNGLLAGSTMTSTAPKTLLVVDRPPAMIAESTFTALIEAGVVVETSFTLSNLIVSGRPPFGRAIA